MNSIQDQTYRERNMLSVFQEQNTRFHWCVLNVFSLVVNKLNEGKATVFSRRKGKEAIETVWLFLQKVGEIAYKTLLYELSALLFLIFSLVKISSMLPSGFWKWLSLLMYFPRQGPQASKCRHPDQLLPVRVTRTTARSQFPFLT